jgi:hypothetical protein
MTNARVIGLRLTVKGQHEEHMSITRTFTTSFAMALAVTACDVSEPPPESALTLRSTPSEPELESINCAAKRQVALVSGAQCPAVAGWTSSIVFENVTGELGKFCKYDWIGQGDPTVAALQATAGVLQVASDCGGVFDHSTDAVWDAVGPDVQAAFHYGIGRPTADDLSLSTSEASRSKVYVAVVDSVPEPRPAVPRSLHGEFMVALINDIACPGGTENCAVEVVRQLGLPRYIDENGVRDLVDPDRGGYYGTQRDTAAAIYRSVQTWRATDLQANPSKLIINLSVGWDRELYGDVDDPGPRPAVAAVHAAIEWARCFGVIVIAASGNRSYSCVRGPTAPGAWEQHPAPTASRCNALGAPPPPTGIGYSPLLYSVGGLTHDHMPMARSRVHGMPRLAALATNAVAGDATRTLTGTSISSAVATAAAALVWSYNPHLTPQAVMSTIYQTGSETSLQADYALPNTANMDVHAINVCAALEAACNLSSSNCPADPFAAPLACLDMAEPQSLSVVFDQLETAYDNSVSATIIGEEIECDNECSEFAAGMFLADDAGPAECPEPSSMAQPYTLPQPTQMGCPNCTFDVTSSVVYASLDPSFATATITDVTIAVVDGDRRTTYFRYGPLDLNVGSITAITLEATQVPATVRSASIAITFAGYAAPIVDPLLIGP